jgi:hypothetical protein
MLKLYFTLQIQKSRKMDKLRLETEYETGILACIDWVAGGNFDGYLYRITLLFQETKVVKMKKIMVDQSSYDDSTEETELESIGSYATTDHGIITCTFEKFEMRGVFLGTDSEYLAFSYKGAHFPPFYAECFKLKLGANQIFNN